MFVASAEQRRAALDFIIEHCTKFGFGPSVREVTEAIGKRSSRTGLMVIEALEEDGLVVRDLSKGRKILCQHCARESSI